MTRILHHYRPHLDRPEDLEAISVAREALLNEMLSRLQRWDPGASRQHFLLVGPRGIGKTHVLRLLQHRILKTPDLRRKWFPLVFAEEQYAVTSVPDLLIETLRLLSEASGDRGLAEHHLRLKKEADDQAVVDLACAALRGFCTPRQSGILLMLENVDRLLRNQIKKDAQVSLLRKILIEENWPVLVATSPTYLSSVTDPEKPLFEFFQVEFLDELSPEGVETLLRKRAELNGDRDFLAYLDRYHSRLRALYHFSGGNPRLTLMLYDLLARQAITDIKIELDGLLDQLTPFYQERMKEIGAQEAKVLTTMALLAEGVTPTELADECRMDRTLVSALLSRLEKAGYVRREPRSQRQTIYTIPERFFRIWHQMSSSRFARGRIQYLLDFFFTWYATREERDEVWNGLTAQFQRGVTRHEENRTDDISAYMDYIATISEGTERFGRHFDRLRQHARVGDSRRVMQGLDELDHEFYEDADYFMHKGRFLATELGSNQKALAAFRRASELNREQLAALFNEAVALDKLGRKRGARTAYDRAVQLLLSQRQCPVGDDATQFLVHMLCEETDARLVRIAAYLLGRTADNAVCTQLTDALKHLDVPWRRAYCAIALGLLGASDAVPVLVECLGDETELLRGSVATVLGKMCARAAVPALIQRLHDSADNVRGSAAMALGRIRASEAVPPLLECLRDQADNVRTSAARALGSICTLEAVPLLVQVLRDEARCVRARAAMALGKIGASSAVPALMECLHDEVRFVRASAARALGKIKASEAVLALIECLQDEAGNVRMSAAKALGDIRALDAVPSLIQLLHDEARGARGSAAAALGRIGASRATPMLIECLDDEADYVRATAARGLGNIRALEAIPALIQALHDQAHHVRANAAMALGKIGTPEALPLLIQCLRDQAKDVRSSAAIALGKVAGAGAVPALIRSLDDEARAVRAASARALGWIKAREAAPQLIRSLRDDASCVRASAATALANTDSREAIPALIGALRDKAGDVRGSAASALGNIGSCEAIPALVEALRDKADNVRGSAATALGRVGTLEAIAAVVDAIPDIAEVLRAQAEESRIGGAGFFLRAAFRSGNLSVVQPFVEGFTSRLDEGEEAFMAHRIALDFLRRDRDPTILQRQSPEVREAVELLVSLFDQAQKGD